MVDITFGACFTEFIGRALNLRFTGHGFESWLGAIA